MAKYKFWRDIPEPKDEYVKDLFYNTGTEWVIGTCVTEAMCDAAHVVTVALFSGNIAKAHNFLG